MGTGFYGKYQNTKGATLSRNLDSVNSSMMRTYLLSLGENSSLYSSANESYQLSIESYQEEDSSNLPFKNALIEELRASNVKFTEDEIVFITKDKSGQLVWLESGNILKHILDRHAKDFQDKHGVSPEELPKYLEAVFKHGDVKYSRLSGSGTEKLYEYKNSYYILSGVGDNGFIVSCYPIDETAAIKLIERYQ